MVISTGARAPWIGGCFVTRWADPSTQSPDRSGHLVVGRSLFSNDTSHLEVGNWACLVAQMVKNLPAAQEVWVQSLGQEDLLEKEMATHSSILVWRIPQTEEPDRLQSIGSRRVGHDIHQFLSVPWKYPIYFPQALSSLAAKLMLFIKWVVS